MDILQLVKDWLEDDMSGKWLLIIDNADDSDVLYSPTTQSARLADHIPRSENGCILLITRNGKVGHKFATVHGVVTLLAMTLDESESNTNSS